jgi:hypothetical protein
MIAINSLKKKGGFMIRLAGVFFAGLFVVVFCACASAPVVHTMADLTQRHTELAPVKMQQSGLSAAQKECFSKLPLVYGKAEINGKEMPQSVVRQVFGFIPGEQVVGSMKYRRGIAVFSTHAVYFIGEVTLRRVLGMEVDYRQTQMGDQADFYMDIPYVEIPGYKGELKISKEEDSFGNKMDVYTYISDFGDGKKYVFREFKLEDFFQAFSQASHSSGQEEVSAPAENP